MKLFSANGARIAALLLAVMMVLTVFAACTNKQNTPAPTEEPVMTEEVTEAPTDEPTEEPTEAAPVVEGSIVGTWEGEINIADQMNQAFAEDETGMLSGVTISDTFFTLTMTFNEDGTYVIQPEAESYKAAVASAAKEMVPVMKDLMMAMFSAMSEDGEQMTEEQVLEALEIKSWDELGEQMLADIDENEDDLVEEGTYELKDGKLSITNADGDVEVIAVTVGENELSFDAIESGEGANISSGMLPMVFNRVA